MRFYTGDESGLIKAVDIDHKVSLLEAQAKAAKKARADAKAKANAKPDEKVEIEDNVLLGVKVETFNGSISKQRHIQQMNMAEYMGDSAIFVARKNGSIEAISKATSESLYEFSEPGFADAVSVKRNGRNISQREYVGLGIGKDGFVSCTNLGNVRFQKFSADVDADADIDSDASKSSGFGLMKLPVDVVRMRAHKDKFSVFAAGGREQELSIWDAETACVGSEYAEPKCKPLFRSENVAPDWLGLRVPVWITDMQFLDGNTTNPQMVVSTRHSHIRIYDAKAQQRPVHSWEIGKNPILNIVASHVKPEIFYSDNLGNLNQLDLRTGKVIGGFKGISGAVTDIALSEDGRRVAEVGLDRFLRVYEADGMRRMLHRAYVKQRVTGVVWDWEVKDIDQDEIDRQETEEIWQSMDTLGQKEKHKREAKRKAKAIA
ncbi:Ribosome biogenesis protein nsa1 (NOP7-associated protein 1) [Coemansia asiatica]|uniref:Ribosome biogenesis protein NSA1 n=1 Tax=Coemansia asiatica TaxID=1052880 RepID=A0A9W7XMD5_9FUNG|nr:Ribosome biogenesis protein nsa1 (NOP7-associated protein 1) [Coemansia asiatica]